MIVPIASILFFIMFINNIHFVNLHIYLKTSLHYYEREFLYKSSYIIIGYFFAKINENPSIKQNSLLSGGAYEVSHNALFTKNQLNLIDVILFYSICP